MRILSFLFFIIYLFSCATHFTYYSSLKNLLSSEDYIKAESIIENNKFKEYGEKNALLYWLDKAITLHYAGKYQESILCFDKAEKLAEELYTKSITEEASSFLISDNVRSYQGEDFEKIFINVFQALNYLFLGKYEEALVEARKVDHKLKTLQVNYNNKNVYKEDAFMRYLTGLLYESQGELNDAFVSYRKAINEYLTNYKIYNFAIPQDLIFRSLKIAKSLGFKEEFEEIAKKNKLNISLKDINSTTDDKAEVIIFHYNGFAPYKIDHYIEVSFGEGWGYVGSIEVSNDEQKDLQKARQIARSIASEEQFLVAFPKFVPEQNRISYAVVEFYDIRGNVFLTQKTFIAENIETIAIQNLEDRIAKIRMKSIARAAIKYALSREITHKLTKDSDELSKWLVKKALQVTSAAVEQADKRSWRTLPKEINLCIASLPEDEYNVKIKFYDKSGILIQEKSLGKIKTKKGKKTFLAVRTYI
ncbi:MAG: COG3014 family protein [Endomicrobiia bacterium]